MPPRLPLSQRTPADPRPHREGGEAEASRQAQTPNLVTDRRIGKGQGRGGLRHRGAAGFPYLRRPQYAPLSTKTVGGRIIPKCRTEEVPFWNLGRQLRAGERSMPRPRFRPSLFLGLLATLVPAFASAQRVVAWGDNSLGQLNVPATLNGPIQISAGFAHTVALQSNGVPAAWGWNGYGQCYIPTSSTVNQVSAGYLHSLGLFGGQVWAVGNNEDGQCDVPSNATQGFRIAGGGFHTLILNSSGGITAYGNNNNGQCNVPAGLGAASDVAAGYVHSVALLTNGTVAAWGSNQDGQSTVPAGLSGVERIASGGFHNLALKWSGTVVAWGSNLSG
ncbi:hypothetical protein EON81_14590, partial [bacterium]